MSGKKPKSVSFNEKNERDQEILEWIDKEGICFAPFVKDLLYEAM